jgi:hypothetical protein
MRNMSPGDLPSSLTLILFAVSILATICLCEPDDFIRFLFDIYADSTNENVISMSNLELLLRTIFGSVGGQKSVEFMIPVSLSQSCGRKLSLHVLICLCCK